MVAVGHMGRVQEVLQQDVIRQRDWGMSRQQQQQQQRWQYTAAEGNSSIKVRHLQRKKTYALHRTASQGCLPIHTASTLLTQQC
jgi:hypothetical protein